MADEQIISVSGGEESLRMLSEMKEAMSLVSEFALKTGVALEGTDKQLSSMNTQYSMLLTSLSSYDLMMKSVAQTTLSAFENQKKITESTKDQTGVNEDLVALNTTLVSLLKDQGDMQVESLAMQKEKTAEQQKQKALLEEEHAKEKEKKEKEKQEKQHLEGISKTAKAISDPAGAVGDLLMKAAPELAIAAAVAGVAKSGFDAYRGYEKLAAGGGTSLEGMGGASGVAKFELESQINSFMGYGSAQESSAAMTTLMKAGLRGDELANTFKGLGERAESAGLKMSDYAELIGKFSRSWGGSPGTLKEAEAAIKTTGDRAESLGFIKDEFIKSVSEVAIKSRVAMKTNTGFTGMSAPGAVTVEAAVVASRIALEKFQSKVYEGELSQQQLNDFIIEKVKEGKTTKTMSSEFDEFSSLGNASGQRVGDLMSQMATLSDKYLKYSTDRASSDINAMGLIKETTGTMGEFEKGLRTGKYSFETLTAILDDMVVKFDATPAQITKFSEHFDTIGKGLGLSAPELAKGATAMAESLMVKSKDITANDALKYSQDTVTAFASMIKRHAITIPELTKATEELITEFGFSKEAAKEQIRAYVGLHDTLGIATASLMQWGSSIGKDLEPIFKSPEEAFKMGKQAASAFGKLIEENKATTAQASSIIKMQVDMLGGSTTDAYDKLKLLAKVVESTSLRMDELTTFLTANSAAMRASGIGQTLAMEQMAAFSTFLKDGSLSMQAFTAYVKGPMADTDAVKAMAYDTAKGQSGPLGDAARSMSLPAWMSLENQLGKAATGSIGEGMKAQFGTEKTKEFYADMLKQIVALNAGEEEKIRSGFGAESGNTSLDAVWRTEQINKVLRPGWDMPNTDGTAMDMQMSGTLNEMIKNQDMTKKDWDSPLKDASGKFLSGSDLFRRAVDQFTEATAHLADEPIVTIPDDYKSPGSVRDGASASPGYGGSKSKPAVAPAPLKKHKRGAKSKGKKRK